MPTTGTRASALHPAPLHDPEAVERALRDTFTSAVVDELRAKTGYNPRQRLVTAARLMLTVVEGFLLGQTLSFASLRALFIRRFGFVQSCPFQNRFKQKEAAAFFRAALEHVVQATVSAAGLELTGALRSFEDVLVYDGTGQRVPPRGRKQLPACTRGKAGTKWVIGYSLKSGLIEHGAFGPETASESPLWKRLVPEFKAGALYLLDLGFFERQVFIDAKKAGADVLMRLKSTAKVRVLGHRIGGSMHPVPKWSLSYYLTSVTKRRGTVFDLDVEWGRGKHAVVLRLVGIAHNSRKIRWYLTTIPRHVMVARQVIQTYRLRWLIELLFRELKQATDLGRSFTADADAIEALTYGAMLAHVVVRSLRIHAALAAEVPLGQLRPLACLHVARAFAAELVSALAMSGRGGWSRFVSRFTEVVVGMAREVTPSRSRYRIARELGAIGG